MDACSYIKARRVWMVSSFVGVYVWGLIQTQILDWSIFTTLLISGAILFVLWIFVRFASMVMLLSLSCLLASIVATEPQLTESTLTTLLLGVLTTVIFPFLLVLLDISRDTVKTIGGSVVAWSAYYAIVPIFLIVAAAIAPYCILSAPLIGLIGIIIFSTATHFILDVYRKPKV